MNFENPVVFLGAGAVRPEDLRLVLNFADEIVAADGGAAHSLEAGHLPAAVIGDFDSLEAEVRKDIPQDRLFRIADQDTTDFEKCLARVSAPLILGLGFVGPRMDHALSAFGALVRYPDQRCILVGDDDVIYHAPPEISLDLPVGCRASLFPMAAVWGESEGLRWPIDGIVFEPSGRVGTSNEVSASPVRLRLSNPGMLIILPRDQLPAAIAALGG